MSTILARVGAIGFILSFSCVMPAYAAADRLKVDSQRVTNKEVTVASVNVTEDALVVIHPRNQAGDAMDMSVALGYVTVKAGRSANVKVPLESTISPGTVLYAVLYADAGERGRFEPGIDKPILRPASYTFRVK